MRMALTLASLAGALCLATVTSCQVVYEGQSAE